MILSFNFYYAHPGLAEAVLRQRLRACEVRTRLGLPRGSVLVRMHGNDALPDVIWELEFDAIEGHVRDMDARAASPEFEAVRAEMRKLCRRFERPLFEVDSAALREPSSSPKAACVVMDWVYCTPEATASIAPALQAQSLRAGETTTGNTLAKLLTVGDDLPQLIWKREYPGAMAPQPLALAEETPLWADLAPSLPHRHARSVWTTA